MQKFFAVAALLLSMTSMVTAAPVAVANAQMRTTGTNNVSDNRATMLDPQSGTPVPYDASRVDVTPKTVQPGARV